MSVVSLDFFPNQTSVHRNRYYFFREITTFIKVCVAFVFRLQTLSMIDFTRIFQLKGLKSKNKGRTKFYESWDLTKTYI